MFNAALSFLRRWRRPPRPPPPPAAATASLDPLPGLDPSWVVLHGVATPWGAIDHVVELPDGRVLLVRRRLDGGRVTLQGQFLLIDGQSPGVNLIEETIRQTAWLRQVVAERMKRQVRVDAVIAFDRAQLPEHATPLLVRGVRVVATADAPRLFGAMPADARPAGEQAPSPPDAPRLSRLKPPLLR